MSKQDETMEEQRPWFKEPWLWFIIALPAVSVIASLYSLYLAVSHPDYLVVEEQRYQEIRSALRAQSPGQATVDPNAVTGNGEDGEP